MVWAGNSYLLGIILTSTDMRLRHRSNDCSKDPSAYPTLAPTDSLIFMWKDLESCFEPRFICGLVLLGFRVLFAEVMVRGGSEAPLGYRVGTPGTARGLLPCNLFPFLYHFILG